MTLLYPSPLSYYAKLSINSTVLIVIKVMQNFSFYIVIDAHFFLNKLSQIVVIRSSNLFYPFLFIACKTYFRPHIHWNSLYPLRTQNIKNYVILLF